MVTLPETENANMNMKKNVPKIRFKGCQGEWSSSTFIETFQFLKNNSLSRACLGSNGDVKNVHYGDVLIRFGENLDVGKEALPYISDGSYGRVLAKRCSLQDGDVIIADAAEDNTVGKATELMSVGDNTVVSGLHTIPCRPTLTFEPCYLGYYLNSKAYHNQLLPLIQGTKICSISKHALEKTIVSFPPTLPEQRQIAAYFRSLDGILSGCEARLSSLRRLKEGALQAFFPQQGETQPRIRFKGCKGEWERKKAKDIFTAFDERKRPDLPVLSAYQDIRGMAIRSESGYDISHDHSNEITYKHVLPGQFVIHLRSFQGGFAHSSVEGITSPAYTVFGFKDAERHDDYYWKYIFMSKTFINRLKLITYGIRDGRSISFTDFADFEFDVPSLPEQRQIANFFRTLDRRIELERQRLEKLKQLKAACLEKMFV